MANPALEDAFDASVAVVRHLFTSPDSDFAVVLVTAPDGDTVTAAGPLAHLEEGTRARIAGEWKDHPKYGPQVQASLGYELDPDDADGTRKYLLTIRGVGKTRAAALIERYGDDLFDGDRRRPRGGVRSPARHGRARARPRPPTRGASGGRCASSTCCWPRTAPAGWPHSCTTRTGRARPAWFAPSPTC